MNVKTLNLYLTDTFNIPLDVYDFTESDSKIASFEGNITSGFIPRFRIYPSCGFSSSVTMTSASPLVEYVTGSLVLYSGTGDCTGTYISKTTSTFSNSSDYLTFGFNADGKSKSWIPFTVDFSSGSISQGIHIVSATLKLTAWDTEVLTDGMDCRVKVGFQNVKNPTAPTTWTTLNQATLTSNPFAAYIIETWNEGETYSIDITDSAKALFGTDGITWTNGSGVGILLQDYGSSTGGYRTATSHNGNETEPSYLNPYLEIVYGNNYYTDTFLDTYMSYSNKNQLNYNNAKIVVGEPTASSNQKYRGLIKVDFSFIPTSASVTSASMCLYLESKKASTSHYIELHRITSIDWDLNTACWNRPHGTSNITWNGATSYYETATAGSALLTPTSTLGYKTIPIDVSKINDILHLTNSNYGVLLKMNTELNDQYSFASSQTTSGISRKPYLQITYTEDNINYTTKRIYNDQIIDI